MSETTFKEKFHSNLTYKNSTKARSLVRYLLTSINRDLDPEGFDETAVSIEHIMPQNPTKWGLTKNEIKSYVNLIGNLTLIHPDMNGRMGNKTLQEKIPVLQESQIKLNQELILLMGNEQEISIEESNQEELDMRTNNMIWNSEIIEKRSDILCEKALQIWKL